MITLVKLDTLELLKSITKQDILIINLVEQWHKDKGIDSKIIIAQSAFINSLDEVIFHKKNNWYFSIDNLLDGVSRTVEEVYRVEEIV